jgi:hypothetical protein
MEESDSPEERVKVRVRKAKDDFTNIVPHGERNPLAKCDVIGCYMGSNLAIPGAASTPDGIRYCDAHYVAWRKSKLRIDLNAYYFSMYQSEMQMMRDDSVKQGMFY